MMEINDAYINIKKLYQFCTVLTRPKGRLTKDEIDELIKRFISGQSICKIGRDMKRRQRTIIQHLIRAGLIKEEIIFQAEKNIKRELDISISITDNINGCFSYIKYNLYLLFIRKIL